MKTRLPALLRSAVEWFQKGPRMHSDKPPSREELRALLLELLSDPATARQVAPMWGQALGVQGGSPGDENFLAKFDSSGNATLNSIAKEVSGNIGIGTTTPSVAKLQVAAGATPSLYLSSTQRYQVGLNYNGDSAKEWWLVADTNGDFAIHENLIGDRLTVQNATGNVGIGTTTPSVAKLQVAAGATPSLYLSSTQPFQVGLNYGGDANKEWWLVANAGGDFAIHENLIGDRLTVQNATGNVGIGIADRLCKLTVKGNPSFPAAGTVSTTAGLAAVTGTGTSFTKQVGVGDRITVPNDPGETRTVIAIADDTHLTVDIAFSANKSGKTMTVLPSLFRIDDASGTERVHVTDQGNVHIGGSPEIQSQWKSLLFGADSPRQVTFGPEMITAVGPPPGGTDNRRVVLWAGKTDGSSKPDTEAMFIINANGWLEWGEGGNSDQDVLLERSAANQLTLRDTFAVAQTGDAQPKIALKPDGTGIHFGDGSASLDVAIKRPSAGVLNIQMIPAPGTVVFAVDVLNQRIGFYGATPIAKPTINGSRGNNAALTDLLTKLQALGLVVDATTMT